MGSHRRNPAAGLVLDTTSDDLQCRATGSGHESEVAGRVGTVTLRGKALHPAAKATRLDGSAKRWMPDAGRRPPAGYALSAPCRSRAMGGSFSAQTSPVICVRRWSTAASMTVRRYFAIRRGRVVLPPAGPLLALVASTPPLCDLNVTVVHVIEAVHYNLASVPQAQVRSGGWVRARRSPSGNLPNLRPAPGPLPEGQGPGPASHAVRASAPTGTALEPW
jgi:hypothetical protein